MNAFMKATCSRSRVAIALVVCSLVVGFAPQSIAQSAPTPDAAQPGTSSTTNFSGTVERYLLNREGMADGLILNNGLQVKVPPHLSDSLVNTVKAGDRVTLTGFPGVSSRFGQEVHAYSITNTSSGKRLVDQPSTVPPLPPTPIAINYSSLSASGTAQHWLVGRGGELHGIVLADGTQVQFPPHVGYQLTNLAQPGANVEVQGVGTKSRYGKVLEATALTINGQTVAIDAAMPGVPLQGQRGGLPPAGMPPAPGVLPAGAPLAPSASPAPTSTSDSPVVTPALIPPN